MIKEWFQKMNFPGNKIVPFGCAITEYDFFEIYMGRRLLPARDRVVSIGDGP